MFLNFCHLFKEGIFMMNILFIATTLLVAFSARAEILNSSPIVEAVIKSQCSEVKRLLGNGASANTIFTDPATKKDTTIIFIAASRSDVCTLRALISYRADLNYVWYWKTGDVMWLKESTPLSMAIRHALRSKNLNIMKILLDNGARPDMKASDGVSFVDHVLNNLEQVVGDDKNDLKDAKIIASDIRRIIKGSASR